MFYIIRFMGKKTFIPLAFLPKLKGERLLAEYNPTTNAEIVCDNQKKQNFINKFVCIFVKDDCAQTKAIKAHAKTDDIEFLEYDYIGSKWNFYFFEEQLVFVVAGQYVMPVGIYNRSFLPAQDDPRHDLCLYFNLVLELWPGYKIHCGLKNYHNSSKPLQTKVIANNITNNFKSSIKIPKSVVLKLNRKKAKNFLSDKKLIVKSCSGVRSRVESNKIFSTWEHANLNNIPTFFQEHIEGMDIRVHSIKSNTYSVQVKSKQGVDYRYNQNSGYDLYCLPENIQKFCNLLRNIEKLHLVGTDLILNRVSNTYYVLECNPNPGWAGFHRKSQQEQCIVKDVLDVHYGK